MDAAPLATRGDKIAAATRILWEGLSREGVDWLGFYEINEAGDAMLLLSREPKPACSPIGLHGVCGRSWRERLPQIVEDVHALGGDHIVCDPENLSEVVVPCLEAGGECWGVLDLDSRSPSAFSSSDAEGLRRVLIASGLSAK